MSRTEEATGIDRLANPGDSRVLIVNGDIVDPNDRRRADIAVSGGLVVEVGENLDTEGAEHVIDAAGCVVSTGFVDLRTCVGEPGDEQIETVESAGRGAVLGGFTTVLAMPSTTPTIDNASSVRDMLRLAERSLCRIRPVGAVTKGRNGNELAEMAEMAGLGVTMFCDDEVTIADSGVLRRAMEYAGGIGATLAQHCVDPSLAAGAIMHEGEWSSRLGMQGSPAAAEEIAIVRDLTLARLTGTSLHIQHVSTAGGVEAIRRAKADGLEVTCHVAPYHFTSTDADCASFDPSFRVEPPLRSAADVAAVKAGLADGTIDAIASDHTPRAPEDKEAPFDQAPPGMLGLETTLALAVTELDMSIEQIVEKLSWRPAQIARLGDVHSGVVAAGRVADLVVIDVDHQWTISGAAMASNSRNCPYDGRTVKGRVRHTLVGGKLVVADQQVVG
ncbi:MAG: dihydroorotase [Actinomycetia bacterium]|nr:dihydroorotase [Actinomycetes bacterium]